jgi:hypothetical protein
VATNFNFNSTCGCGGRLLRSERDLAFYSRVGNSRVANLSICSSPSIPLSHLRPLTPPSSRERNQDYDYPYQHHVIIGVEEVYYEGNETCPCRPFFWSWEDFDGEEEVPANAMRRILGNLQDSMGDLAEESARLSGRPWCIHLPKSKP